MTKPIDLKPVYDALVKIMKKSEKKFESVYQQQKHQLIDWSYVREVQVRVMVWRRADKEEIC